MRFLFIRLQRKLPRMQLFLFNIEVLIVKLIWTIYNKVQYIIICRYINEKTYAKVFYETYIRP